MHRKDGEPVDVYGDGFFTEDSLWDVPGYENFTAGEDAADVTVYMAVREEPVPYLQLNSGGAVPPLLMISTACISASREMQEILPAAGSAVRARHCVCLVSYPSPAGGTAEGGEKAGRSHSPRARGDLVAGGCPGSPLHGVLHRIRRLLSL